MKTSTCNISISATDYECLMEHLFPGDGDEHGAVLKAGVVIDGDQLRLVVRDIALAKEGSDYVKGKIGHRALHPTFIHRQITSCRDQKLAYLAVHNHGSDDYVAFSRVDMESHERGYPALLDIARGVPIGGLVFGRRSVEADIWLPNGGRLALNEFRVIGSAVARLRSSPDRYGSADHEFDRQVRMFGEAGQAVLNASKIAVVGLGGIGSLIAEYLGRLGVGNIILIDPDVIEDTNLSRVVGATHQDVMHSMRKIDIAKRHLSEANTRARVTLIFNDVAKSSVAAQLRQCDFIFLAADSMRARLVVNALVHQYLIPAIQVGAKIRISENGSLEDAMSAVRQLRPGYGCLWCNQLIDPTQLAIEAKTDEERKAQAYGTQQPNPSVITMNAVAAGHAVNDFLFDFLGLRAMNNKVDYQHFHFTNRKAQIVHPRKDEHCRECGKVDGRYGMGDAASLPCLDD
ncbi:MAG: ThiF family adenylyltransferase [Aestuariivirga sp.]